MKDRLAAAERDKYRRMWQEPAYRRSSPGRNIAPTALLELMPRAGESLTDYGCGEARASRWFARRGLIVTCVDIVRLKPRVIEACLWDLPETLNATDYAFCCDVMEHIPTRKVDAVLEGIRRRTLKAAFFQIALVQCSHGRRIGETLHLTVKPAEWWRKRLMKFWPETKMRPGGSEWRVWAVCR